MENTCFGCVYLTVGGEGTTHYWVCSLKDIAVNPSDGCEDKEDKNA